jgi:hypothetical protein
MKRILMIGILLSSFPLLSGCMDIPLAGLTWTAPAANQVLFQDDFSDPTSGWMTLTDANQVMDYELNGFRIWANRTDIDVWSVPRLQLSDVRIDVDATKLAGPDDNDFGIICRYQDPQNFYGFLISSDGYFGISRRLNGDHSLVGMATMQHDAVIRTGSASNHIQAECKGTSLTLSVNGKQLITVQAADFPEGDVGLLAGTFAQPGVDILFDNYVVVSP